MEIITQYSTNDVLVGIVDSGIYRYIDLTNKINISLSKSYASENSDDSFIDNNGYGTFISGIISGVNYNKNGILGVFPKTQLVSLKYNPITDLQKK